MSIPSDPKAVQKGSNHKRPAVEFTSASSFVSPPNFHNKHPESPVIKRPKHDESWRSGVTQQKQEPIQSPTQMNSNNFNHGTSSSSSLSLDVCVKNMMKKEINIFSSESKKMKEENIRKIEEVKNIFNTKLQGVQKYIDEKVNVLSKSETESAEKRSFEIPPSFEERISRMEEDIAELKIQVNKIVESLSNPETIIEERIAAVVEEKLEQRKEVVVSKDPKWFIPENKCKELYNYSQGQVGRFLADYLPILYDLPGIIAPYKSDEKGEEARAVIDHFWNGSLTTDLCIKEIEKEHANQRYKISRKIYQALRNSAGCIMSRTGSIYECNWDEDKKKFIPKIGESEILRPQEDENESLRIKKVEFEWAIPKDIIKEKFVKNDYMIVAKNDDLNQTRISKIELDTLELQMLYTKRKYGNN